VGTGLFLLFAAVFVFVAAVWISNSRYFVERRVAQWQRDFEAQLRREPESALRDRISKSDYWSLTEKRPIGETPTVQEFFRRFDAEEYDAILAGLGDGDFICSVFHAAERSIGYEDRPMMMDYAGQFILVLKELRSRKAGRAPRRDT
jgi:hypothetical protein